MTREEAKKLIDTAAGAYSSWRMSEHYADGDEQTQKELYKAAEKQLLDALCAEPAAPQARMSFEEFKDQLKEIIFSPLWPSPDLIQLRSLYDRIHSADAGKMGDGEDFYCYVNLRELKGWSFMTVARKPFPGSRKFHAVEIKEN